MMKEDKSW